MVPVRLPTHKIANMMRPCCFLFLAVAVLATKVVHSFHFVVQYGGGHRTRQIARAVNRDLLNDLNDAFQYEGRLPSASPEFRCGFVCIIGAPNMGKSTLMNAILQEDLCVATRRPQTTRHAILGVMTTSNCQLCLVDTPGIIHEPAYKLQEGMMEAVKTSLKDADVLLVVTDLFSTPIADDELFKRVQMTSKPVIVVVNKVDLASNVRSDVMNSDEGSEQVRTVTVEDAVRQWRKLLPNALLILPVSASQNNNIGVIALRKFLLGEDDVADALRNMGRPIPGMFRVGVKLVTADDAKALLPQGPPLFDSDTLTDRPERFFAAEMIRGAILQVFQKEVPYCCEVVVTEFKEPKPNGLNPVLRMKATIFVERENQKLIVVGKGGQQIKQVGIVAREQLESFFKEKVYLELHVVVADNWRNNDDSLKEFGYR